MSSVRVVCDSNFTKTADIDKSVGKVLKMFKSHLEKKTAPLSKSSDMECVYLYTKLTPDKVRLMKKLLNSNKTLLHFKEIIISEPGKCKIEDCKDDNSDYDSCRDSCSDDENTKNSCEDSEKSEKSKTSCMESEKSENSNSSCDSESVLSKICSKPFKSKKLMNKRKQEISKQLRELADEIEKFSMT